jgi:hypothetical protein
MYKKRNGVSTRPSMPIYKEECLFVCLSVRYAFRHRTSKCNQTLQGILFRPEEGQRLLFIKKIYPPPAKGRTMYLTNEIAAFGSIGEVLNSTL